MATKVSVVRAGTYLRRDFQDAARELLFFGQFGLSAAKLRWIWSRFFLQSAEWKELRYRAIKRFGGKCLACGRSGKDYVLNVDHIRPRRRHPQLALDLGNLQVLCADCNRGKGHRDATDWRAR